MTPNEVKNIMVTKQRLINLLPKNIFKIIPFSLLSSNYFISGSIFSELFHNQSDKDIKEKIDNWRKTNINLFLINSQFSDFTMAENGWVLLNNNSKFHTPYTLYQRDGLFLFIYTPNVTTTKEEIISTFDYLHCTPTLHFTLNGPKLSITPKAFNAIKNKHLIQNSKEPVEYKRREKFLSRGYIEPEIKREFDPILINIVRQTIPQKMAYDLCGVQPIYKPDEQKT